MLYPLVLLAACAGETTAPEAPVTPTPPSAPSTPVGFRILPGTVTIEIHQRIRFRGEVRTLKGQVYAPKMVWEASGGSITPAGIFSAGRPGTYRVVGRGHGRGNVHARRPDTSVVVVVPRQPGLTGIRVTPRPPQLTVGEKRTFTARGQLANGTYAAIGVTWAATGGTIDHAGFYRAGNAPGTYHVIATNTRGSMADTVMIRVSAPVTPDTSAVPSPNPGPSPTPIPWPGAAPTIARLVLQPASVYLATRATHQFAVFGQTSLGDSVAVEVTFRATGGRITPTGLYTAGRTAGTYRVIATSSELADTAVVTLGRTSGGGATPVPGPTPGPTPIPGAGTGTPFALWALLAANAPRGAFTGSLDGYTAARILDQLAEARAKRLHVLMNMTGGSHRNYMTNGVFDMAKWRAKMDTYNTPTIKAAVAAAVADGTIIGNSVMDEPANISGWRPGVVDGPGNYWGPPGTMTKARVDEMCRYVKQMFPTLPVGVVHNHRIFEPEKNYQHCDFLLAQYRLSKGDIRAYRDDGLAFAKRSGIAIAFSLNVIHGGTPGRNCEKWGDDPYGVLCPMTGEQLREWGLVLGSAGCALTMWRYEREYFAKPEIQEASRAIAESLAKLPRRPCTRP